MYQLRESIRLVHFFYYVDKTEPICELLSNWGFVNLFTRPRRFGKSLNMSMLYHFFSLEGDKSIFEGLDISKEKDICQEHMGKYPVIFISLKSINAASYETAFQLAVQVINEVAAKAQKLLDDYECAFCYDVVKEWYDGYRFGNVNVYCPWDVLNYCDSLRDNPKAQPQNYWINTSSNDAVKKFIEKSENITIKREIERLMAGEIITKEIHQELTNKDMYNSVENIWSVLFTTGYLTQRGTPEGKALKLAIPNREILDIFSTHVMDYFKENVKKDGETLKSFCDALQSGDAETVEKIFEQYLKKTISLRDTFVQKGQKENFYHGILIGILGVKDQWGITSNGESGEGYSDILVETQDGETGIIIEVKYAHDGNLDAVCQKAVSQMEEKKYGQEFFEDGVENILKYGIACYKKRCRVMLAGK